MKKVKAEYLEFIGQIQRDGSAITPVKESHLKAMVGNSLMREEEFMLHPLSITEKTYVAFGFNVFVVKIKEW